MAARARAMSCSLKSESFMAPCARRDEADDGDVSLTHLVKLVVCRHVEVAVTWETSVRLDASEKPLIATTEVEEDDFRLALSLAPAPRPSASPSTHLVTDLKASSIAPLTCAYRQFQHDGQQAGGKTAWLASGAGRMPSCLAKRMPASKHCMRRNRLELSKLLRGGRVSGEAAARAGRGCLEMADEGRHGVITKATSVIRRRNELKLGVTFGQGGRQGPDGRGCGT
eukprot:757305-Hanusia_phi.AAC.3